MPPATIYLTAAWFKEEKSSLKSSISLAEIRVKKSLLP
jgi:hypothetical protein